MSTRSSVTDDTSGYESMMANASTVSGFRRSVSRNSTKSHDSMAPMSQFVKSQSSVDGSGASDEDERVSPIVMLQRNDSVESSGASSNGHSQLSPQRVSTEHQRKGTRPSDIGYFDVPSVKQSRSSSRKSTSKSKMRRQHARFRKSELRSPRSKKSSSPKKVSQSDQRKLDNIDLKKLVNMLADKGHVEHAAVVEDLGMEVRTKTTYFSMVDEEIQRLCLLFRIPVSSAKEGFDIDKEHFNISRCDDIALHAQSKDDRTRGIVVCKSKTFYVIGTYNAEVPAAYCMEAMEMLAEYLTSRDR